MKAMIIGATALLLCTASKPAASDTAWPARLVGTWEGNVGGQRYTEEWRRMDDATYEGTSATWAGDKQVASERIRLTRFADQWVYLANPGGRSISAFVRVDADADTWVFENKEHDYPERIGYRLTGTDELTAWIAGGTDEERRMEFRLHRVK